MKNEYQAIILNNLNPRKVNITSPLLPLYLLPLTLYHSHLNSLIILIIRRQSSFDYEFIYIQFICGTHLTMNSYLFNSCVFFCKQTSRYLYPV